MNGKGIVGIIIAALVLMFLLWSCSGGSDSATNRGNTSKCTICGKKATHSTSSYGYCDKHWRDMIDSVLD